MGSARAKVPSRTVRTTTIEFAAIVVSVFLMVPSEAAFQVQQP
jgi:hypothetical protein